MSDKLVFSKLEASSRNGYSTYYAVPEEQRDGMKTGNGNTAFIVVHDDKVVFAPVDYKSQYDGMHKCNEYIDLAIKEEDYYPGENSIQNIKDNYTQELEYKVMGLEAEIDEILRVLYKNCPDKLEWIKLNYPNFKE